MLKFARRSRSTSADRASAAKNTASPPAASPVQKVMQKTNTRDFSPSSTPRSSRRTISLERIPVKSRRQLNFSEPAPATPPRHRREFANPPLMATRSKIPLPTSSPIPPPVVRRAALTSTSRPRVPSPPPLPKEDGTESSEDHADYQSLSSTTLCRLAPMTPTLVKLQRAAKGVAPPPPPPKSVLKRGGNARYDFHRAVERLVEKLDLQLLDTSSESGYGSEQDVDSLNSVSSNATAASAATAASSSEASTAPSTEQSPPPPPLPRRRGRRRVQFDSYVLLLQGLKERNLELVQANVREVCREAMSTDEVTLEVMRCVVDSEEAILREVLAHGFDANFADPAGLTPLHLAAAFNLLPVIKLLIANGAAVFARAHSSGQTPSAMCSPRVRNYEACQAYLRCMEECLGVANGGACHAARPYRTCRSDELCVAAGERVVVRRKGDYEGSAWWWCESGDGRQQGYVLKDLLALNRPSSSQ